MEERRSTGIGRAISTLPIANRRAILPISADLKDSSEIASHREAIGFLLGDNAGQRDGKSLLFAPARRVCPATAFVDGRKPLITGLLPRRTRLMPAIQSPWIRSAWPLPAGHVSVPFPNTSAAIGISFYTPTVSECLYLDGQSCQYMR